MASIREARARGTKFNRRVMDALNGYGWWSWDGFMGRRGLKVVMEEWVATGTAVGPYGFEYCN